METRVVGIVEETEKFPLCEESYIANEKGEVVAKIYRLC